MPVPQFHWECESTTDAQRDNVRELQLWPAPGNATTSGELFDDDGETHGWQKGNALWLSWTLTSSASRLELIIEKRGDYQPAWRDMAISLPPGEKRPLWVNGEMTTCYRLA